MKNLLVLFFCLLLAVASTAQSYGAGISYVLNVPSYTPNVAAKASEICYSINAKTLYHWDRTSSNWKPIAGITTLSTVPSGAPTLGQSRTAVNLTTGILYRWDGSAWQEIGSGGGTISGTGTAGRIPFWSGTSSLGNSILSQVTSPAPRIGINTLTPAYALDVVATEPIRIPNLASFGTGNLGAMYARNTGGNAPMFHDDTTYRQVAITTGVPRWAVWTSNQRGDAFGNSQLTFRDNFLGVRTDVPAYVVDAFGNIASDGLLRLTNTNASGHSAMLVSDNGGGIRGYFGYANASAPQTALQGRTYMFTNNNNGVISTSGSFPLLFFQHNATGNLQRVGFGTATPSTSVDMTGLAGYMRVMSNAADPAGASGGVHFNSTINRHQFHNGTSWGDAVRAPAGQLLFGASGGNGVTSSSGIIWDSGTGMLLTPTTIGGGIVIRSAQAQLIGVGPATGALAIEFGYASSNGNFFNDVLAGDAVIRGPSNTSNRRIMLGAESSAGAGPSTMQIGLRTVGINLGTNTTIYPLDVRGSISGDNVLSIRNSAANGYSTIIAMDNTGAAAFQVGYANASTGHPLVTARNYFSGNNKDFLISTNGASSAIFFAQHSTQNIGFGGVTNPSEQIHANGNIRATAQLILGPNQGRIIEGTGSPEGVVTAPPGSMYMNTGGTGEFAHYIKRSGTGNTGWEPTPTGAQRQLTFAGGSNTISQSLFNSHRDIYILAQVPVGATENCTITPPAPNATNFLRSFTVVAEDQDAATWNVFVSSSGGLWLTSSGSSAPGTASSIQLSGSANNLVIARFVCLEISTGVYRWVLQSRSSL